MAPTSSIAASENEALCVECDARTFKPICIRVRADEEEQMIDRTACFLAGADLPAHAFQHAVAAFKGVDSCACHHLDIEDRGCARPGSGTSLPPRSDLRTSIQTLAPWLAK